MVILALFPNNILHYKEPVLLGEMADSRTRSGKVQEELGAFFYDIR